MCGIVGYIGHRQADELIIKGLERLEYRGYDSAGIAIINDGLTVHKKAGKVKALRKLIDHTDTSGTLGIGHTRWATHGEPNDDNAHPHTGNSGRLALVHNGIIENYAVLKSALIAEGHSFSSDTDSEVLVHLIEEIQDGGNLPLEEAVRLALNRVEGAYGIAVIDQNEPQKMVGARRQSPLVVGIGDEEYFIGSDATPFLDSTKRVVYLEDGQVATICLKTGLKIKSSDNETQPPFIHTLDMQIEALEKGGYEHFMLKEIYEQPKTILDAMRGRISSKDSRVTLRGMEEFANRFVRANRIIIVACGTSYHSGLPQPHP